MIGQINSDSLKELIQLFTRPGTRDMPQVALFTSDLVMTTWSQGPSETMLPFDSIFKKLVNFVIPNLLFKVVFFVISTEFS